MARWARLATPQGASYAIAQTSGWNLLTLAPWAGGLPNGVTIPSSEAQFLAPVQPSKILCVGRNYRAHAAELGNDIPVEPLLFFKPPSSILNPGEPILLPAVSQRVDHEAELGVVIGRRCHRISEQEAPRVIAAYTCVNDVTARDLQKRDGQWARAKGFDTFCPVGPILVEAPDLAQLSVICRVNGQERQRGRIQDMIFSVPQLISYISQIFTLEPGDLLVTGTPEGVAPLVAGDIVEIDIPGIGLLSNPVRNAD